MLAVKPEQLEIDYNLSSQEEASRPLLKEGFFCTQTIEDEVPIAGSTSQYILEIPEKPINDTVNVIIYGFAGSEPAYRGLARAMSAEQGLITLRCKLSRTQKFEAMMHPSHLFKPTALSSKLVKGAISALPNHGLDSRVNLFGHSMGGFIGTQLANHKPHLIKQLTLFSSAGLVDHSPRTLAPGAPKLVGRLAIDLLKRHEFRPSPIDSLNCLKHIASNPMLTIGEMLVASSCDIRQLIRQLDPNVKVAIMQPRNDELFNINQVSAEMAGATDNFRVIDRVGHASPITHPSFIAQEYARLITDSALPS